MAAVKVIVMLHWVKNRMHNFDGLAIIRCKVSCMHGKRRLHDL